MTITKTIADSQTASDAKHAMATAWHGWRLALQVVVRALASVILLAFAAYFSILPTMATVAEFQRGAWSEALVGLLLSVVFLSLSGWLLFWAGVFAGVVEKQTPNRQPSEIPR